MSTCIIYITFPNPKDATKIARLLIEERLAACINIFPSTQSIYRWEGQIVQAEETIIIAKTLEQNAQSLMNFVLKHHPSECPAMIVLPIKDGHPAFLEWIAQEADLKKKAASCI